MARSIRDNMKRRIAQAVNHLANAVLDVNDVYSLFKNAGKPECEALERTMIGMAQLREVLLSFAQEAWQLDEDSLMKWV